MLANTKLLLRTNGAQITQHGSLDDFLAIFYKHDVILINNNEIHCQKLGDYFIRSCAKVN